MNATIPIQLVPPAEADRHDFQGLLNAHGLALPPLSIDLGLPALTLLESSLGASHTQAALTLSLFLAGFGVSQLVMGPL